jgi:hypothetical protein
LAASIPFDNRMATVANLLINRVTVYLLFNEIHSLTGRQGDDA